MAKIDVDNELKIGTKAQIDFACDVLRTLRYVIQRIKMEQRKSWKTDDLLELMDELILEITTGVTEEDKQRQIYVRQGKNAFKAGQARNSNPYDRHAKQHLWWDTGWHDAEHEQKLASLVTIKPSELPASSKIRYYKVQIKENSQIVEWNDVLHVFVAEGNGTLFDDYDKATSTARRLQSNTTGLVLVLEAHHQ